MLFRKRGLVATLAAGLLTGGCFLMTLSGVTFQVGNDLITTVRTDLILATCVQGGSTGGNVECTYFFFDENGVPVSSTSSANLISEFGLLGVLIDPLIVQIPDDMRINAATYDTGSGPQPLEVIVTGAVPVDAETTMVAEAGRKFAILELPDAVAPMVPSGSAMNGLGMSLAIEFGRTLAPEALTDPFEIKAMFTIPYEVGPTTYYVPLLPCVTDFALVPAIQIDPAVANQDLIGLASALALAAQACNDQPYDYFELGPLALPAVGELDFGPVLLGQSRARVLILGSAGFSDLSVTSVQAPTDAAYSILRDDCTGVSVPSGQGCEVEIEFDPSAAGIVSDSITFLTNDASIPSTQVQLTGEGTTLLADPGSSCDSVDFGRVGETAQLVFRHFIWNSGGSNLTLGSVTVGDAVNFAIGLDDCGDSVLAPSFGCAVEVVYQPPSAGHHSTDLTVVTNDPSGDSVVALAGESQSDLIYQGDFESLCVAAPP